MKRTRNSVNHVVGEIYVHLFLRYYVHMVALMNLFLSLALSII